MQEDAEWMRVPDNVPNGSLIKRCRAALIDGVATLAAAGTFGLFVSGELSNAGAAIPAVGFSWWLLFLGRDMFIERGTRSLAKSCSDLKSCAQMDRCRRAGIRLAGVSTFLSTPQVPC